jgi:oligopeptide/dipeptide ABC transporter ATP-binding protein
MADETSRPVLEVRNLHAVYDSARGPVHALNGVTFTVRSGEVLALVGESGSGKSATALAVMGLLPKTSGRILSGEIRFDGRNLLEFSERELRQIRGSGVALVFQNPMTTLNPTMSIGAQLREVIREHQGLSRHAADARAVQLLEMVEISDAAARLKSYPHQLSGGLRQRVMIALALSCDPKLLIADEATTALDVTTQAQILRLLRRVTAKLGTAMLVITHNMGVVAGLADRVAVMYAGRIVENGAVGEIFHAPKHPYTVGLLSAIPRMDGARTGDLLTIEGRPPSLLHTIRGCPFADRCWLTMDGCIDPGPPPTSPQVHSAACIADVEDVRRGPGRVPVGASVGQPASGKDVL